MSATNSKIRQEINDKTTKKLIFVFSDGESADAHRLQQAIQARRAQGVFVYGIGIGDEADITHYLTHQQEQGSGEICSNPAQLAQIMKKLLVDIIK
ncbi:MAG: VWA domain-containing protein [Candidatus Peribacteria bacterium]|jgi:nitric oxide reductase activation protein|nr:VWA domain-containing protein [Candidatus Peribacteria bacterium]